MGVRWRLRAGMAAAWLGAATVAACSGGGGTRPPPGGGDGAVPDAPLDAAAGDTATDVPTADAHDAARDAPSVVDGALDGATSSARNVTCADSPPAGAPEPAPLPAFSGGTCPALVPGENVLATARGERRFQLAVPAEPRAGEQLPVLFMWHWLGGSGTSFFEKGEVQMAVDHDRFIGVAPEVKGDLLEKWPYLTGFLGDGRLEEELAFFDDMLACVAAAYEVNRSCVGTIGVSAGALWSAQLAARRSTLLASFVSLSGGTNHTFVRPWAGAEHKLPALVLWGGSGDFCGVAFEPASQDLESNLVADGHFLLECVHNCGHAEPPFEPPTGLSKFTFVWRFVLDHPYWLDDGESRYLATGLPPDTTPPWCGIGPGSAAPRSEGACPPSGCAP